MAPYVAKALSRYVLGPGAPPEPIELQLPVDSAPRDAPAPDSGVPVPVALRAAGVTP